jgi:predicted ATPase/class 3 adenylate cyclase
VELPSLAGAVTFLFTDIEGSTRLWEQEPQRMEPALACHDALARTAVECHRGTVVKTTGDGIYAIFEQPVDAIDAALQLQQALADPRATNGVGLRVRCGLHLGVVERRDDDYFGSAVNRTARIMAVAHGGQVIVSRAVVDRVADRLPPQVALRDLGTVRLKDLARPERVYQVIHPQLRQDFPALRSLEATPNNLPQQITSFVGREREVADIQRLLASGRLLTLVGPGGIGKTRLALHAAAHVLDGYSDGVWFVELAAIGTPTLVPREVAQVLGIREEVGTTLTQTICTTLKARRLLLILDNCEHLVFACAALIDELVRAVPDIRVIATSREALCIAGEQTYLLPALSLPDAKARVEDQARSHAVQLFVERAQLHKPTFTLTAQCASAIAEICKQLDGIPLALELAAAKVGTMSLVKIASRLGNRLSLLTDGSRTALPKQQTLRAMLDWSYDLLGDGEKAVFAQIAIFAGGWTLDAAVAVIGGGRIAQRDVVDHLTGLVRKSLVAFDGQADRYRMLETIREYASERLLDSGEEGNFRERSQSYFLALAEQGALVHLNGGKLDHWTELLRLENDNLRAALRRSLEEPRGAEAAMRFCGALYPFWWRWGLAREGRDWCDCALGIAPTTEISRARLSALFAAGVMQYTVGEVVMAQTLYRQALDLSLQLGDLAFEGRIIVSLANAELSLGNTGTAKTLYERSIEIERTQGNLLREVVGLNGLASLFLNDGNLAAAEAPLERALSLSQLLDNREQEAYTISRLGGIAQYQRNYDVAQTRHSKALAIARELGVRELESEQQRHLAEVAVARGEFQIARALFREALALSREQDSWFAIRECLDAMVALATATHEYAVATKFAGATERMREVMRAPRFPIDQERFQENLTQCRGAMGETAYVAGIAAGRVLRPDEAVDAALRWVQ